MSFQARELEGLRSCDGAPDEIQCQLNVKFLFKMTIKVLKEFAFS